MYVPSLSVRKGREVVKEAERKQHGDIEERLAARKGSGRYYIGASVRLPAAEGGSDSQLRASRFRRGLTRTCHADAGAAGVSYRSTRPFVGWWKKIARQKESCRVVESRLAVLNGCQPQRP